MLGLPADEAAQLDLSHFANRGGLLPGTYPVSVLLNDELVSQQQLEFVSDPDSPGSLLACLTAENLVEWGVMVAESARAANGAGCSSGSPVNAIVPGSSETLNIRQWLLSIAVPQAQMERGSWLRTPAARWDDGFPAVLFNYAVSGVSQTHQGRHYESRFFSFNSALNLDGWRVRNDSTLQQGTHRSDRWNALNTYAKRSFSSFQGGELTLGQAGTDGALFESVAFTGAQVVSDDGMLAPALASFAPVIRGIATSPSVVTVRRNGSVVYQQNVQTGPFELLDIPQGVANGDLQVEIRGADDQVQRYTQPVSSVPQLLRSGRIRYSLAMGQYRKDRASQAPTPNFVQGTLGWGLAHGTTLYAGTQLADNYHSGLLGAGQYVPVVGAFALDVTQARAEFARSRSHLGTQRGEAYRFSYARAFDPTSTTLNVAGYQYRSKGFYSFAEVQERQQSLQRQAELINALGSNLYHKRSQLQLSVSQRLGGYGSLSLSANRVNYWGMNDSAKHLRAAYSTSLAGVSVGLSAGINRSPRRRVTDELLTLNLSLPMSKLFGSQNTGSVNAFSSKNNHSLQHQVGVSGSLLEGKNLSYSVAQGVGNEGQGYGGDSNLSYSGTYGMVNAGYSYQRDAELWSYGARGGVLASEHGVVFSQPVSFTSGNALVKAPGAAGVGVNNGTGIKTDWRGYAVVPNLSPFQKSNVALDINQLPDDVELKSTDKRLVPTRGAVVLASFDTFRGKRALVNLTYRGQPVPFGAMAVVDSGDGAQSSVVGDGGQAYIMGVGDSGSLKVSWGGRADQQCVARYQLPDDEVAVHVMGAVCE